MTKIIPKLGLNDIRDAELDEYVEDKVVRIGALPEFAAVSPDAPTVNAKRIEYKDSLVASDHGGPAETAFKVQKRAELEEMVTSQAYSAAAIANGDTALFLRTGYQIKDTKGTPTGPLPQVLGVELSFGVSEGELNISWAPLEDALNFTIQFYTDPIDPTLSLIKEIMTGKIGKRKILVTGLPSGQKVYARVRANGGNNGNGPWSDPAEKRVP